MSIPSGFLRAPLTSVQMGGSKSLGFVKKSPFCWILKVGFMSLALYGTVMSAEKVEAPSSSDRFCFSDCVTCPVICSPPPPPLVTTTPHPPPPLPSVPSAPHSLSQPPPKSPPPPPPPFKSYNTPPSSGSSQPLPTVISGPHDFSYPYYYFYASAASSLSIHASFFVLLLFLIGFSIVG